MPAGNIIEINNLSFTYPRTISGRTCTAIRNISLDISQGEMVVITGPSGSGKSTFCRCLNGLIPHARRGTMTGDVVVAGMSTRNHYITDYSPIVGLVFQNPDDHLVTGDVDSEIAFGPEQLGWDPSDIERGIQKTVRSLGIDHLRGRAIQELSWGERQRVAIASVAVINPRVLVLDEPLSGIDETGSMFLIDYLSSLNERDDTTVIVVEHRLDRVRRIARRVVMFSDGTITFNGSGTDFFPSKRFTKTDTPHINHREYGGRPVAVGHPPIVSLRHVSYSYPGSSCRSLSDIDLDFYPYEITFIKGPNGSGKSTLIRHLNGILAPDEGVVLVSGRPIREKTVADLSRIVGTLLQHADYQLFEETISEELAFGPSNFGLAGDEIALRSRAVSEDLDIGHLGQNTPPLSLSAGEKQRVAIGGLLMMKSPVIALDEPTIGLDYRLKLRLADLMKKYRDEGTAVIIATHDREFSTLCADRIVRMSEGNIVADYRVRNDDPPLLQEHDGRTGSQ